MEPPGGGVSVGGLTTYETNGRLTTKTDEMSVSPGSMSGNYAANWFCTTSVANFIMFLAINSRENMVTLQLSTF